MEFSFEGRIWTGVYSRDSNRKFEKDLSVKMWQIEGDWRLSSFIILNSNGDSKEVVEMRGRQYTFSF